ncbi:MAG: 4-(cytidine 5'-diphospho)-2-C-methyl-D-erythritol kinase [Roseburia sp.]|nr:4-(cytidine 5'-diphospho)-2-C-methyl-D-erythritol kinase [Anaeroplasma bactoclasticum]MCM1196293.1 4-(cytidine 5'-diphospho)-2-C-methyl-D-erythritol kinase [Roseburia sp.]MCM1557456.1 4-(cytidine 5'-diphospho)-2-C-methyl-D-erythritol kinase [Anaeroplasma bactoclasticum]
MIFEKAYAKINLALGVGKEADGYHEVENLMVPIDLYDELFFEKTIEDSLECEEDIPNNICLKAIHLFKEKFLIKECVHITLHKKIPIMAGLAGGSSDAAATLRGLNRLFEVDASYEDLYEIASQLGSDVPFFLRNQIALCTGRGEIIEPVDIDFKGISLLLIKPDFGLSTKEVYDNYVYNGISKKVELQNLLEAIKNKDYDEIDKWIFNDLQETALRLSPALTELFQKIYNLSYIPHISGSGPTIFLLDAKYVDLENVKALDDTLTLYLCHTI